MSISYRDAGVDLEAAEAITARITARLGSGLFGGFVPVSQLKTYDDPVLVSSIDGVGTKVRLAAHLGRIEGLGKDIVHHCVNDITCHGATPLFFLDYLAFHHLDDGTVGTIVAAIAEACEALGIALAGGETAEMPLLYPPGHFDMAGAIIGAVERAAIVDGREIAEGDVIVGLASAGLHTNGYSLVQRVLPDEEYGRYDAALGATVGEALLEPHRCYLFDVRSLLGTGGVHGLAHITGGGITGNLSRIIPSHLQAVVELPPPPPLFTYLQGWGVERDEMRRVFNMGIGMVAVCDRGLQSDVDSTRFQVIGDVRKSESMWRVQFRDNN